MMREEASTTPLKSRIAGLGTERVGDFLRHNRRTFWTVMALIMILIANRIISSSFFSVRAVT